MRKKDKEILITDLKKDFSFLRSPEGEKRILDKLQKLESNSEHYLAPWLSISKEQEFVYPGQGLLRTSYDGLPAHSLEMLPMGMILKTLRLRMFFLEMFNHPYRVHFLKQVNDRPFVAPFKIESKMFEAAISSGVSLSIGDLGASILGASRPRISRNERYAEGPFVKIGRQARTLFLGSASPDVWNTGIAIATMAASHCIAGIPRNGLMSDVKRQVDLATEVFAHLRDLEEIILGERQDRKLISSWWKKNVMGVLETKITSALKRAEALYGAGVRCFRVYSPEPGTDQIEVVKALRKEFGNEVEIFSGQVVEVGQAKDLESIGTDGIYVGVGGGGRCITGVRSGSVVDWPELVWNLRSEINIPVIVEGGASDHVAVTLLLGASGISVSRIVAGGTIESPGGALFCRGDSGKLYKPYGGEASARTKYLDGKLLPFGVASFVEGETTKAEMSYIQGVLPTLTYNLHLLFEDAILALVFRGVADVTELQAMDPSPLRQITSSGEFQRNSH